MTRRDRGVTRRRPVSAALALAAAIVTGCSFDAAPPPPRFDHVVIVIEENHSAAQVMGSPYLSSLAAGGVSFSAMHGITHPSQPNYLALFSGSTQGIADDGTYDLSAPNLATRLEAAGLHFATYSEDLPAVGSRVVTSGAYARKHNPAASFTNVPATDNLPFTLFPADYSQLPTVSFVIPNLNNDMHDGTVAAGDAWLQAHLGAYASWAASHRSLLVVTFDECGGSDPPASTPIATVFSGAFLAPGVSAEPVTLYSLLRMVEEMYGLPALAEEISAARITGAWK